MSASGGSARLPVGQAREAARQALRRIERSSGFLRDELHAIFHRLDLPARDRALATQLATGTVRHRRTLRLLLSHLRGEAGREAEIQPVLRTILEVAAFQLLFLNRVPAYAAVDEAVEAARQTVAGPRGEKAAGFVNAMLRGLGRLIAGRHPDGRPDRDALPHPEGGVVRLCEPVLPDPKDSRAAFLGAAYSYPDWLVARWLDAYGGAAEEVCRWGNRRPHLFARVNPARARASDLPRAVRPGPRAGCYDVSDLPVEELEALLAGGVLTVQDPSAMAAVEALAPAAGENVLDLCASPGTKTTQIVEAMGDRGRVVACDRSADKLEPIRRTVAARGLASVTVCLSADATLRSSGATSLRSTSVAAAAPAGGFDAALVDVPCSNTGVLSRRVEARWRLRPRDLQELPRIQSDLLAAAAGRVRPGGRLVYSTCSLERDENEGVVRAFLGQGEGWRLLRHELILPAADHDGAFWALLHRSRQDRRPT